VGKHIHQGCLRVYDIIDLSKTQSLSRAYPIGSTSFKFYDTNKMYDLLKASKKVQSLYEGRHYLILHWVLKSKNCFSTNTLRVASISFG